MQVLFQTDNLIQISNNITKVMRTFPQSKQSDLDKRSLPLGIMVPGLTQLLKIGTSIYLDSKK